ncbi:MAG TPA: hypothetical protein PL037_05335, partial [Elusimicrobiales bacterium]|nr:hypothetical protein [Elusimicrobiales bacterium]
MKWLKIAVFGAGLACASEFSALAGDVSAGAAPGTLNYQGRLERDNAPITGPVHITFRIYDASSGGSAVYTAPEQLINAVQGIFSASINPPVSIFSSARNLYLEIQVESDVLSPREQLNSVAFALVSKKLEDGADLSVATLTTTGRVGIGTTPSIYSLTVDSSVWVRSGVLRFPDNTVMTSAGVASVGTLTNAGSAYIIADNALPPTGTGDIVFQRGTTTRAKITNAGDMGIGPLASATPLGRLDVDGSVYVGSEGVYDRTGGSVTVSGLYVRGGGITGAGGENIQLGRTDNVISFVSGGAERMRVHSNGSVGIGLAAPSDSLQAAGEISSNLGVRGGRVSIGDYSNWTALSNEIMSESGYDLLIQQTNSYNVGIGTNTPREKLHVNGTIRADRGVEASTAVFSGGVTVGGSFTVASGGGNTASLPSTTINGNLLVTG